MTDPNQTNNTKWVTENKANIEEWKVKYTLNQTA